MNCAKIITIFLCAMFSTSSMAEIEPLSLPPIQLLAPAKPTPIIVNVPETMMDKDDIAQWKDIVQALYMAADTPTKYEFIFNVAGFGGRLDVLNKVMNAVQYAEKNGVKVKMRVIGSAYSAHATLVCATKNVEVMPTGSLMYHKGAVQKQYFGILSYRDPDGIKSLAPQESALDRTLLYRCVQNGILTALEFNYVQLGREVIAIPSEGRFIVRPDQESFLDGVANACKAIATLCIILVLYLVFLRKLIQMIISDIRKAWKGE